MTYQPADSSRSLLWLVALGFFMQTLDSTIVNTALPTMARSLNENPLHMHTVIIAYTLSVAVLMPASGWLSERFGTRRVFFIAILLFTFGSVCCAASQSTNQLILSRILQGVGGAMLVPVGRLAVLRAFPRDRFLKAMSFVTIPGLIGPLVGPALGGLIVEFASWRWIFLINIPFGLVAGYLTSRVMPDFRENDPMRFDIAGYALLAFSMLAISISLDGASDFGFRRATVIFLVFSGFAALIAYWLHAARSRTPLFSLNLFSVPAFSVGILGNLFARIGNGSMPFLIPLLLQVNIGFPPLKAGMMMIPIALAGMLSKSLAVPFVRYFGYRRALAGNTLMVGLLIASFSSISHDTPFWMLLLLLFIFGAVNSLQFTIMNSVTLKDLSAHQAASGNSLLSMVTQLSMSLGISTAGALLAVLSGAMDNGTTNPQAFSVTFVCMGAITVASAWIFLQLRENRENATPSEQTS